MAAFGGMTLTNKGLVLQGKAQAGTPLNYTRIAVGDGSLSGQSIPALNSLISPKKSLPVIRLQIQPPNKAVIGTVLRNAEMTSGFYFREVGVFAQDPDAGEILYAYANAGTSAEYIAPGGGSDVIEKAFNCIVAVGTAANVTAVIDESLVFARESEFTTHRTAAELDHPDGSVTAAKLAPAAATDAAIGSRTVSDSTAPTGDAGTLTGILGWLANMVKGITGKTSWRTPPATTLEAASGHMKDTTVHLTPAERTLWNAKETTTGAQAKADAAQAAAIAAAAADAAAKANAAAAASIPASQKGVANGLATLDGTTRLPAGQLPASVPQQTTADVTYYVRTDGNDGNNGLANTAAGAFRTIGKAISVLPRVINHAVVINVAAGSYAEELLFDGFNGRGSLYVVGSSTLAGATNYKIKNVHGSRNTIRININGFESTDAPLGRNSASANIIENPGFFEFAQFRSVFVDTTKTGICAVGSPAVSSYQCEISGKSYQCFAAYMGRVNAQELSGSGNTYRFRAITGGIISYLGVTSTGTDVASDGAIIIPGSGILNPWGDNTLTSRSRVRSGPSGAQTITSGTFSKLVAPFASEYVDALGEYTPSQAKFVATQTGEYFVRAVIEMSIGSAAAGTGAHLRPSVNGTYWPIAGSVTVLGPGTYRIEAVCLITLNVGDVLEWYMYQNFGASVTTNADSNFTYLNLIRVA
ncbi:phage tail-collar fiber domain-containing protein [Paenibacillus glufosinatiresistens]|uniref:phage tail-collar fiber domain-containing protein n=1 Tax=Paenibacillus glufosinatiresistens TaxID=3070657 RepID=UPI00286DDDCD|nr:phage tail protein [Paenibacillus sp. YX.27]